MHKLTPRRSMFGAFRVAVLLGVVALFLGGCIFRVAYDPVQESRYSSSGGQSGSDAAFCRARANRAVPGLPPPPMVGYPPPPLTEQFRENNRRTAEATRIRLEREDQFNWCMRSLGY